MACRNCRRQLFQLARPANSPLTRKLSSTPSEQQLSLYRAATMPVTNDQRRCFRSTPSRHKPEGEASKPLLNRLQRAITPSKEPYRVLGASKVIYDRCASAASYKIDPIAIQADTIPKTPEGEHLGEGGTIWHTDFNLPPTFSTWSQVTMLHMYLMFARVRDFEKDAAKSWQAQLVDHFFFDAEERMDMNHGISSRALRGRYLKDLFVQWRGVVAAYDEGVAKGDAVLASAVWRNVYKAREDVSARHLAAVVSWMRLTLKTLDQMPDEMLAAKPAAALSWPVNNQFAVVDEPMPQVRITDPERKKTAAATPT